MATLAEIRSSIIDQLSGHMPTDDTRVEEAFVEGVIRSKRALLAREQAKSGVGLPSAYYQDLTCLKVERGELECSGEATGVAKVIVPIPALIDVRGSVAYFGKLDTSTGGFRQVGLAGFLSGAASRFCTGPSFTVMGEEIWLRDVDEVVEEVRLIAVLRDPAYLACFPDFEQMEYPIPSTMVHTLETLCLKQLISTLPIAPDKQNDGEDGAQQTRRLNPNSIPE